MGYRADGDLAAMFDERPMLAAIERTADRSVGELEGRVREHTPVAHPPPGIDVAEWEASRKGRPPGALRASWERTRVETREGGAVAEGTVLTRDPMAPLVEWETRPHVIRPKADRGPATVVATGRPRGTVADGRASLRFPAQGGGVAYAKEVHHPGTRGAHMMARSLTELVVEWQRIGREEMARWAREQLR